MGERDGSGGSAVVHVLKCGQPWFKWGGGGQGADTDERFQRGGVTAVFFSKLLQKLDPFCFF